MHKQNVRIPLCLGLATMLAVVALSVRLPSELVSRYPGVGAIAPVAPASAQILDRWAVSTRVYEQLPELPRENHYEHRETGDVETHNTLVFRLIQYHHDINFRPLRSRFDWKLTLADYMGVNEPMIPESYPGFFLAESPHSTDIEAIRALDRQQREQLIQALLTALSPQDTVQ